MSNQPYIGESQRDEHDPATNTKKVMMYGWNADTLEKVRLSVNTDGSLIAPGFSLPSYDYIGVTYPTTSSEAYAYKRGGAGGTLIATLTVTYTDATKEVLSSVTKS